MKYFFAFMILVNTTAFSQSGSNMEPELSGNPVVDLMKIDDSYQTPQQISAGIYTPEKKSPMLAALMSAVLPGSGELYAGKYWRAAAFFLVDAGLVTFAFINDNKGDDATVEYQNFADENWSVEKYAEWMNLHKGANIPLNPVNWDSLNYYERQVPTFSHTLPPHGDQQYYEQIGKYHQYAPGWNQFDINNGDAGDIPPIFLHYAKMRGDANSYYDWATRLVVFIYINHLLSAIDAAWAAAQYNSDLAIKFRLEEKRYAWFREWQPTVNIKYYF